MHAHNYRLDVIVPVALSVLFPFLGVYAIACIDDARHPPKTYSTKTLSNASDPAVDASVQSYNEYTNWAYGFRQNKFEWQSRSSKVIFFTSLLVAITGIALAIWQFVEASKTTRQMEEATETSVKLSFGALAFKSRSLATFMMFVSIAYLVIYVKYVHPISEIIDNPKPTVFPDESGSSANENSGDASALPRSSGGARAAFTVSTFDRRP